MRLRIRGQELGQAVAAGQICQSHELCENRDEIAVLHQPPICTQTVFRLKKALRQRSDQVLRVVHDDREIVDAIVPTEVRH
jgi:hypothetical protein